MQLLKFFLIGSLLGISLQLASSEVVVCYYGSWANYRLGNGQFTVNNIDPTLCTHLIYSFVGLNQDGSVRIMDDWLEIQLQNLKKVNALKKENPGLKTLVAIGGWNEGSVVFSNVAASSSKRKVLVQSVLNFLQTYGFDGFDLDWEYPAQRGGAAADKENYITLIKELRTAFEKKGYLLTAAVAATGSSVDLSYNVPAMSKYLDFINVMAYDLHGSWDGVTGQNAPLYASDIDVTENQKKLNVDASIRGWLSRGADPKKIVLGLGVYGRTFTLSNPNNNKLGAPTSNPGNGGKYTAENGMLGYNEICELALSKDWTEVWDDKQKVPYMTKGNQWIGYDNPRSIGIKVNYAKSLNLAGVMIWSIETDDFRGICGSKYPILNAIKSALGGTSNENAGNDNSETGSGSDSGSGSEPEKETGSGSEQEPSKDSGSETEENPINPSNLCKKEGYIQNPSNCNVFFYCLPHNGAFVALEQKCAVGLYFDEASLSCDYPSVVKCPANAN